MVKQADVLDEMKEAFVLEEKSESVITQAGERDSGSAIPLDPSMARGGVVPNGYSEEIRKGRGQREGLDNYTARPSTIPLWAFNGVPSEIPIAYEPGGTNPSISRYLRKRHCQACGKNGFIGKTCTTCGSSDVIAFFYDDYGQVPQKRDWYGDVACLVSEHGDMIGDCPRDGQKHDGQLSGFLSTQQMLMHAVSKHPREYGIWQTMARVPTSPAAQAQMPAADVDMAVLRSELKAELLAELKAEIPESPVEELAPLYVSDKDKTAAVKEDNDGD